MKLFLQIIVAAILILLITALDSSFFPAISGVFTYINITLTVAIYLLIIVNQRIAFLVYSLTTIIIGITSSSLLIIPLLIGLGILFLLNWLFESFFTNRSYYTLLALGTIGWFAYYIIFSIISLVMSFTTANIDYPEINYFWFLGIIIGYSFLAILLTLGYIFTTFISKKFRSYFIISDHTYER